MSSDMYSRPLRQGRGIMTWSFSIGKFGGTVVRVHITFLLLLVWIWFMHYRIGGSSAAWEGVAFIIAVFACVVLHEFGHALAARRYGIKTPDITLLPIGGLARLERMPVIIHKRSSANR